MEKNSVFAIMPSMTYSSHRLQACSVILDDEDKLQ